MFIERKQYPLADGQHATSYEIHDDDGPVVKLSSTEAWDALEWLNAHRSEIFRELHPELNQEREELAKEIPAEPNWKTRAQMGEKPFVDWDPDRYHP